jgi:hypothetical protein
MPTRAEDRTPAGSGAGRPETPRRRHTVPVYLLVDSVDLLIDSEEVDTQAASWPGNGAVRGDWTAIIGSVPRASALLDSPQCNFSVPDSCGLSARALLSAGQWADSTKAELRPYAARRNRHRSPGDEYAAAFFFLPQLQVPRAISHAPQRLWLVDVAGWLLACAMLHLQQEVLRVPAALPVQTTVANQAWTRRGSGKADSKAPKSLPGLRTPAGGSGRR